MKILVLCHGGNHRSVAIATELKSIRGQDAIAAGIGSNSPETIRLLGGWADRIWTVDDWVHERALTFFDASRVVHLGIGADIFQSPKHPKLMALAAEACEAQGFPEKRERTFAVDPKTYAFYPLKPSDGDTHPGHWVQDSDGKWIWRN